MEAVISLVYLLNKRYRPFYKWMHRGMKELPILGESCHEMLAGLCAEAETRRRRRDGGRIIEEISALIVAHLTTCGLSSAESDFLLDHAHAVQAKIERRGLAEPAGD